MALQTGCALWGKQRFGIAGCEASAACRGFATKPRDEIERFRSLLKSGDFIRRISVSCLTDAPAQQRREARQVTDTRFRLSQSEVVASRRRWALDRPRLGRPRRAGAQSARCARYLIELLKTSVCSAPLYFRLTAAFDKAAVLLAEGHFLILAAVCSFLLLAPS